VRSQNDLRAVFRELEDEFDIVLVNAPPFLPTADTVSLLSLRASQLSEHPARRRLPRLRAA